MFKAIYTYFGPRNKKKIIILGTAQFLHSNKLDKCLDFPSAAPGHLGPWCVSAGLTQAPIDGQGCAFPWEPPHPASHLPHADVHPWGSASLPSSRTTFLNFLFVFWGFCHQKKSPAWLVPSQGKGVILSDLWHHAARASDWQDLKAFPTHLTEGILILWEIYERILFPTI